MAKMTQHDIALSDQQKMRHAAIRSQDEREKSLLSREALRHKAERDALIAGFNRLKREWGQRGLTLDEVARRAAIDEGDLAALANDPAPNLSLETLTRIAEAIGVRLTIGVTDQAG